MTIRFELLAERRDAIPIVGRWYHREWGIRLRGETEAEAVARLDRYLNRDSMPFIVVATDGPEILATAQLKYREMETLFPEKEHWLGGVFVGPAYRGRGLGSRIAEQIAARAPGCGVKTLYLQTERLDGGLYRRLGWQPVVQVENEGLDVLVMERHLGR